MLTSLLSRTAIFIVAIPIIFGIIWTVITAFFTPIGCLPFVNECNISFDALSSTVTDKRIIVATCLSIMTGLCATAIAYIVSQVLLAAFYLNPKPKMIFRGLSLFLAIPHISFAIGFSFLFIPHGYFMRLIAFVIGAEDPFSLFHNNGLLLVISMAIREIPFFLLLSFMALKQFPAKRYINNAKLMGYKPHAAWWLVIVPALNARIKLGIFVVLIFAITIVDMPMILGPFLPPTLAVIALQKFQHPDFIEISSAGISAIILVFASLFAVALWTFLSNILSKIFKIIIIKTGRNKLFYFPFIAEIISIIFLTIVVGSLFSLVVWSFAESWRWPAIIPPSYTTSHWSNALPDLLSVISNSIALSFTAGLLGVIIVTITLEAESRLKKTSSYNFLLYSTVLMPQAMFLFGVQILTILLNINQNFITLLWVHLLFVIPYCHLILAEVWKNQDKRYFNIASTLGISANKRLFKIRIPMLISSMFACFAVGFSVSFAQYLPNVIFYSNMPTLTVEAISLASTGNMHIIGVISVTQIILPMLVFYLSFLAPKIYRKIHFVNK